MYCLLCFWHSSYKRLNWCTWIICTVTEGGGEWGTKKKKKEERENHSPSTVGKANDLSQPLLSPRLAERKLPAVPHAFVTDYNLLKISTRNTHRKKIWLHMSAIAAAEQLFKRKKERKNIFKKRRENKPDSNPGQLNCSPACYRLLYGEASRSGRNLCLYHFSVSFTATFSCSTFVVFLKSYCHFWMLFPLVLFFSWGILLFRMFSIAIILWFLLSMKLNSSVSSAKR